MDNKKLLQLLFYISKHSVEHKRLLSSKDIITLLVLQECLSSSSFATIMNKSKDNSWDTHRDLMVIAKGIFQMSLNVTISEHFEEMNQRECTAEHKDLHSVNTISWSDHGVLLPTNNFIKN